MIPQGSMRRLLATTSVELASLLLDVTKVYLWVSLFSDQKPFWVATKAVPGMALAHSWNSSTLACISLTVHIPVSPGSAPSGFQGWWKLHFLSVCSTWYISRLLKPGLDLAQRTASHPGLFLMSHPLHENGSQEAVVAHLQTAVWCVHSFQPSVQVELQVCVL